MKRTVLKRWTAREVEREWPTHRETFARSTAKLGIAPGEDGKFSTQQVITAVFGDEQGERMRKLRAEADLAEMERDQRAGELLSAEAVETVWQEALHEMKTAITAADIPQDLRRQLLDQLKPIPRSDYRRETPAESARATGE